MEKVTQKQIMEKCIYIHQYILDTKEVLKIIKDMDKVNYKIKMENSILNYNI